MKTTAWIPPVRGQYGTTSLMCSPDQASALLQRNTHQNRALSISNANRIASDIAEGRWRANGDTIKFDVNGTLIDGQHRLYAISIGEKSVPVTIAYNVHPDAIRTIDVNRPRQAYDLLAMSGVPNARYVATAARMILAFDDDLQPTQFKATRTEVADFCIGNERLQAAAEWWSSNRGALERARFIMGPTIAFVYIVGDALVADACDFLMFVAEGARLEQNTAALALQRWLLGRASGHALHDTDRHTYMACLVKAFNAHRLATPTKIIVWRRSEPFPKVLTPVFTSAAD